MSSQQSIALTPLAAAVSAALAPAAAAQAQDTGGPTLEEIVVTATKREENLQEIPASIQAIPQVVLEKMGATGIADYSRFIPAVNVVSYSPGSTDIVFRGVQAGGVGIGQSPSSMYIDEMPITASGSQPEVRMYDISRVESLDGPQGTLFGGSAQSGTLRVITNQPDPSQFEAGIDLTLKQGPDTGLSNDVSAMVNLPFGDNRGALRLAGFTATDAGFIDNIFGHTPDSHQWYALPATWGTEDNADVVEEEWNETDFAGGRVGLRWEFNDEWAATITYMTQTMDGGGGNHFDPFAGDLKVVKFNPEYRYDDFDLASLTIEGDLGWAQVVSSTSYFKRDYGNQTDNTVYVKYYQSWACVNYNYDPAIYTGYFVDPTTGLTVLYPRYCFGPSSQSDTLTMQAFDDNLSKFSQEIRLTGGSDRVDWIVGLYYERASDDWISPWGIVTNSSYQDSIAIQYWEQTWGPGFAPNATHGWESNSQVDYEQTAVFGEVTWRINDQWSANVGARWFDRTMDSSYFVENPNTQLNAEFINGPSVASGGTDDIVPKVNISYQPTDDATIYGLYSEGFRPGGTNRGRGNPILPLVYDPDKLKNTEIGIKTLWANGRVRANLTWYDMEWEDFQMTVVDPSFLNGEVWQTVIANVGNAAVTGFHAELDIAVTEGLDFGVNMSSLDAEVTNDIDLNGNPATIEIPAGSRLPNSPEFKMAGWLDYTWNTNFIPGQAFARLQVSHTGDSLNQLTASQNFASGANPLVKTPSFTITDLRFGLVMDNGWQVDLFVNNLTDERAQYSEASGFFELPFSSTQDGRTGISRIYTNRPQEFGIRLSKTWSD